MEQSDIMTVHRLEEACTVDDIREGTVYIGEVQGFAKFGTFVQFNRRVKGLLHISNRVGTYRERDRIFVKVKEIRSNGNIDLIEVSPENYEIVNVSHHVTKTLLGDLGRKIGRTVYVEVEVGQIKQTSGPTIFTLIDETGVEDGAAFIEAGVRAYPEVELNDIVVVSGEVMKRNEKLQIEVSSLKVITGYDADIVRKRISDALDERAEPEDLDFTIESEVLDNLRPQMRQVAKIVRKAVMTSQPIVLRHHADADGISGAVAIETAVTELIKANGGSLDIDHFLFKRNPSKAPFYEIEDITRDLDFATKDYMRFGQKMPLIMMVDNGSTEEDLPAYKMAKVYDLDVVVVDHHHPDAIVDDYLVAHVNPYHVGGDFGVTAGMLASEIARLIHPPVEKRIMHFPAIAGVGDRSEAPERGRYLELVAERYTEEDCLTIANALDYEQFWLRFNDGREIVKDILDISGNHERHKNLVRLLIDESNAAVEVQMEAVMPHIEESMLPNGARLCMIDVEIFAHRFTFPPPGKTSGEVHDRMKQRYPGEPIVTIGFGPDFAVLRSKGVFMNIPQMVRELREEIVGGGINGGGHLVVGSIKFLEGMREKAIKGLIGKISEFPVE